MQSQSLQRLRCPVKRLAFFGAHAAPIRSPHSHASKASEVSVSIPGHKAALSATHDKSQQSRSSREIKRFFFASFLFAIKKKEVGCRAETRRFLLLIIETFSFFRNILNLKIQDQVRGVAAPQPPFFLSRPTKRRQKMAFDCSGVSFVPGMK